MSIIKAIFFAAFIAAVSAQLPGGLSLPEGIVPGGLTEGLPVGGAPAAPEGGEEGATPAAPAAEGRQAAVPNKHIY